MDELTHLDAAGHARMVDVGDKLAGERMARAEAAVVMAPDTLAAIRDQSLPKGDVFAAARFAGIMAAKRTPDLIPLCHTIRLTSVRVELQADGALPGVRVTSVVKAVDRTGVEMEALAAVSVAALTVYDMCKAVDKGMVITDVRLLEKSGGRSGRRLSSEGSDEDRRAL